MRGLRSTRLVGAGCGTLLALSAVACVLVFVLGRQVARAAGGLGLEPAHPLPGRVGVRSGEDLLGYVGRQIDGGAYEAVAIYKYPDVGSDGLAVSCYLRSTSILGLRPSQPGERQAAPGPIAQPVYLGPLPVSLLSSTTCSCFSGDDSREAVRKCQLPFAAETPWRQSY